jgi:hypothetical protein
MTLGGFTIEAQGYDAYGPAILRKILQEVS